MRLRHQLHLFSYQLFLVEHFGLHLSDFLIFGNQLVIFHTELFLQSGNLFFQLCDLTHVVSVLSFSLGHFRWRGMVDGGMMTLHTGVTLQLRHVGALRHLGVHVLLPLPLLLLPALLFRLVTFFFLKNAAVTGRVLLLRLGQGSLVAAATGPTHQLVAVFLQWAESYNQQSSN